ncbi:MAG: ABC transporter ATP-binding protein [Aquificae bacterium]|nr:ABC transporter ATP-binding protein [Aquificota bacterium]
MEAIKAEKIKKIYFLEGEKIEALKGVSLSIEKGEMVALMGPSGSGKSTLLHILGGIDKPTEGNVFINGQNLLSLSDKKLAIFRNKHIGFVFQFHYLLPEFTILENVMLPVQIYNRGGAKEKAEKILRLLGLSHRLKHKPSQVSGGEQQRAAIARAVVNEPDVILADEPTGNLDSKNAQKVMEIFLQMNKEKNVSIVIATHDREIAEYCNRILYLKDGVIEDIIVRT